MDALENWCIAVSAVSVVSGVITTLLPRSSIKSTYLVLSGIILLYVCIQPVTHWREFEIDFEEIISADTEKSTDEDYSSAVVYAVQETYKKYINSLLDEISEESECSECECEYKSDKLFTNKIVITGNLSSEQKEKIIKKLKDIIQDTTVVEFGGDSFE